ncbi:VWA domain-containing protein [Acetobacterium wieringae]|uniref:VWA domain-containing protein n=1 Tax=Acetobacterium wieringae TaxID=52694 RepID=UPI0026E9FF9A|nr:VWA domain-containing protein [Acetobacterium wieringae]
MINNTVFPFVAVVGQEEIKNALIWNVINPQIGGVLISGEKGTAKSSLARGVCKLTVDTELVELPLNTTEDRLLGNVDFEHAIRFGERRFEAGILKKADGNLLYVDEVNLLSDHLVKSLLEAASSGENIIEREGMSYRHASNFVLVGSMNPEEGGLRPQFLDRFGLYVEVKGEVDTRVRAEIVRRRIDYERNPLAFEQKWQDQIVEMSNRIERAREDLSKVVVSDNAMQLAASVVDEANCAGHRAELVIIETAKAIAAMDGRKMLNINDIKEAAKYALPHRIRDVYDQPEAPPPPPEPEESEEQQEQEQNESGNDPEDRSEQADDQVDEAEENPEQESDSEMPEDPADDQTEADDDFFQGGEETLDAPEQIFQIARWMSQTDKGTISKGSGKRSLMVTSSLQGRYVRNRCPVKGEIRDIAIDATLRTAAPYQRYREKNDMAIAINQSDIRVKIREKRTGNTIIFVVDASGSMGANKRMKAVKGAAISMLNDAYQKRDKVGMIVFKNHSAELVLGVTRSVELAEKKLTALPTGGRTPLAAGLNMAVEVVKAGKIKDKDMLPVIVLISDGRATYSDQGKDAFEEALKAAGRIRAEKIKTIVIDTDQSFIKLNLAEKLAVQMDADRYQIEELQANSLMTAVSLSL